MKTAWIFPGQGSQALGMIGDLAESALGQERLEIAERILGWSVLEKCQGDEETLSRTLYTQPCLFVVESILADLLQEKGHFPDLVAGHSLGEYSALYAARVFNFETGLNLVQNRSRLMDAAEGGKMAALMKFDRTSLETVINQTENVVIANDNSAEQVVISGTPEAVDLVLGQVKVKRVMPLKVSGAFHSPLMENAAIQFQQILELVNFRSAKVPVISNVNPSQPITDAEELKSYLIQQMTSSVRWREIILKLLDVGVEKAIEVGPGKVLTGLIKRTVPAIELENISQLADISKGNEDVKLQGSLVGVG
ncbi:MAG: ACP S-malonyltransferase [Microcystis sp. M038S2]|jgi:[acyl-carrier-protein] S-malonyltransferase|uniref:Malonyl CoA-acyl carrier protein transacylase n=3 Tax=Microcystis TaxID=1125 RepID=A0A552FA91_MICAE|nr:MULTISPECIES: ACP S-malonyltransferase [unclassified Microcystis]MCU7244201.1 ACP S-malonyltransferase [Microcystis aeruginosa WS75]NCQ70988.1 ACP S-malonyltransferase [Microcystis aeruginosa W13-16]NCQ75385.1 ACP S-malonyltransferase [Microcystis aeruginosa W13-13]NCQ80679.1 ACP S-malonyltransferase [Microcystis aeruginosa W13-15]NCR15017.1 ACP S-malonyltransferase [Microcystis aeruginosa SX13-11]NCR19451.1 ACP S-malonyltransferase [Microcystis aeruginosa LL13-03]NCR23536.1 ACP S-malonyl